MFTIFRIAALQSRFAPLPKTFHIVFCIIATIVFLCIYLRTKKPSNLLWLLACDLLLILQFYGDKATAAVVAVCEIILLLSIFYLRIKDKRKEKSPDDPDGEKDSKDELKDIEKAVKNERSRLADDSKSDVIAQAFDNEDLS